MLVRELSSKPWRRDVLEDSVSLVRQDGLWFTDVVLIPGADATLADVYEAAFCAVFQQVCGADSDVFSDAYLKYFVTETYADRCDYIRVYLRRGLDEKYLVGKFPTTLAGVYREAD